MNSYFKNNIEYLSAELSRVDLILKLQVLRYRAVKQDSEDFDPLSGTFISEEEIDRILINIKEDDTIFSQNIYEIQSITKSIKELKKQGAKKLYVACTHGLFAGDAIKKLTSAAKSSSIFEVAFKIFINQNFFNSIII